MLVCTITEKSSIWLRTIFLNVHIDINIARCLRSSSISVLEIQLIHIFIRAILELWQICCPHESITITKLRISILLPGDHTIWLNVSSSVTHRLSVDISKFIDGGWDITHISVQVRQHIYRSQIFVIIIHIC
jgi:hypothetical protein